MNAGDPFELGLLYAAFLLAFLVAVGARLPWTRTFGVLILASMAAAAWWVLQSADLVDSLDLEPLLSGQLGDVHRWLPVTVSIVLSIGVMWWTLHREQTRLSPPEPTGEGGTVGRRARLVTVGLGLAAVAAAAFFFPAEASSAPSSASQVPWFVSGLWLMRSAFSPALAFFGIPIAMAAALWAAPHLETRDPETAAPFGGRRDEVPFFLFAWIFVGWLPIAFATFGGIEGAATASPLSERLWNDFLGIETPGWWLIRELPGLALVFCFFVLAPWRLPRWKPTRGAFGRHRRRLGRARYLLMMLIAGLTIWVPLHLLAAWLLDIGPFVHLPELGGFSL